MIDDRRQLLWAAAGGATLLGAMWAIVATGGGWGLDRVAFRAFSVHHFPWLVTHSITVADAGAGAAGAMSLVTVTYAVKHGRGAHAIALIAGYFIAYELADVIKELQSRPRPTMPIIIASGVSFPSSDSALSVGFVLAAALLAPAFSHGLSRGLVRLLGVLTSLATGILTITFRDHFLTDVLAGWGLGIAVFALLLMAAQASGPRRTSRAR